MRSPRASTTTVNSPDRGSSGQETTKVMRKPTTLFVLLLGFCVGCRNGEDVSHEEGHSHDEMPPDVAAVHFENSCDDSVSDELNAAVALVHNMTYHVAAEKFESVAERDPGCGMAYWGIGMTYIHPLWADAPSAEGMAKGLELIENARATDLSPRESAYVDALAGYYENAEKPVRDRLRAFAAGFASLHASYPDDREAKAFHALTNLATAEPGKTDPQIVETSSRLAFEVLEAEPNHPGAHHYLIHTFDTPDLAENAVDVARKYAQLAPEIPHALHMPSHIFTRLGMWDESIALNRRSADAALGMPYEGGVSVHYPHALDYLLFAYLQTGQESKAQAIVADMDAIQMPVEAGPASAYSLAAADGRWALERHDWAAAAAIQARRPADYPWDQFPQFEALSHFAVAIGAARSGDSEIAALASKKLEELEGKTPEGYWRKQVEVMKLAAQAWTAEAKGNTEDAARIMKEAADLEASMLKHAVTPGEILPSSELLGDMMLAHGNAAAALEAYKVSLERTPNRFNSLFGAGQAAEAMGDFDTARDYYAQIVAISGDADTGRTELAYARSQTQPAG